nr:MAG TPA: hypothetical protein [Caudoviricetes sp.]
MGLTCWKLPELDIIAENVQNMLTEFILKVVKTAGFPNYLIISKNIPITVE